jgi:hypothetical protein
MQAAADLCSGRLCCWCTRAGIRKRYVPFCGHAVIAELAASTVIAPDPMAETYARRQPGAEMEAFIDSRIAAMAAALQGGS